MSPTSNVKEKSFTFTLSLQEHAMMMELAAAENRSAANWLRSQILKAYEAAHPKKPKPKK